ncbi:hypothetical protein PRUPE_3G187200, partial [Prunus persica]
IKSVKPQDVVQLANCHLQLANYLQLSVGQLPVTFNSAQQYHVQAPPPPAGYPTRDEPQNSVPVETKSKGDGFWKGCCAALCCCCVLDACF